MFYFDSDRALHQPFCPSWFLGVFYERNKILFQSPVACCYFVSCLFVESINCIWNDVSLSAPDSFESIFIFTLVFDVLETSSQFTCPSINSANTFDYVIITGIVLDWDHVSAWFGNGGESITSQPVKV